MIPDEKRWSNTLSKRYKLKPRIDSGLTKWSFCVGPLRGYRASETLLLYKYVGEELCVCIGRDRCVERPFVKGTAVYRFETGDCFNDFNDKSFPVPRAVNRLHGRICCG